MAELRSGYYGDGLFAMATYEPPKPQKTILWFEGLRMSGEPYQGVHTMGIRDWFKPLAQEHRIIVLSRPRDPQEGSTMEDWVPLYHDLVKDYALGPLWLAGMGSGANLALALAQAHPKTFAQIFLLGGGGRLSLQGKELYQNLADHCLSHNYKKAHGLLARAMSGKMRGLGAWLADMVARSFAGDYGIPEDPLPFVRALYAEEAFDPKGALQAIDAPITHFRGDHERIYAVNEGLGPLYETLTIQGAGYGIAKSHGERIRQHILQALNQA
jgi:pimeloyl-ACP methyl ester carboxylesterase